MGFFDRLGDNISNAPPEAWFSLAQALSGTKNVGTGLAQGLASFGQASQAANKRKALTQAFGSSDLNPLQRQLLESAPDLALPALAQNAFAVAKPAQPTDEMREYDLAKSQGFNGSFFDYQVAKRKSGASSVNVNNLPAEVGARLGMAGGFLERYGEIQDKLGKLNTLQGRAQLLFNTGEGAEIKRHIESGAEALIRQLTGAGKSQEEAQSYASRYLPNALDTPFDLKSKLEGLKYDLEHSAQGIYEGKGGTYKSPADKGDSQTIKYDAQGNRIQ